MMLVFVNEDKELQENFFHTFHQTNKVFCFSEMYDAYKWIKKTPDAPDMIISEVDIHDPSGLQSFKFLETKSKLKNTKLVAFTPEPVEKEQISLVISEGADAVFSRSSLFSDISSYLKYLQTSEPRSKSESKKPSEKK